MLKTITLPINPIASREVFLLALVSSLYKNNLDGWKLFVNFEPPRNSLMEQTLNKMLGYINSLDIEKEIEINKEKLGLDNNLFKCIQKAFDNGSNFNFHLEDDLQLSPDAFNLMNWYLEKFSENDEYFCYGLYSADSFLERPLEIISMKFFSGWGWGTFKNKWGKHFIPYWFDKKLAEEKFGVSNYKYLGKEIEYSWDLCILAHCLKEDLSMLRPCLGRSKHIGMVGVHTSPDRFFRDFANIKINSIPYESLSSDYFLYNKLETDNGLR